MNNMYLKHTYKLWLFFKSVTFYGECVILSSTASTNNRRFLLPVIQVTYLSEKWMLLVSCHWFLIILLAKSCGDW